MKREFRRAARLVIVDQINSVLLFQYEDGGRRWWATPGGGLEENETFEEAAAREPGRSCPSPISASRRYGRALLISPLMVGRFANSSTISFSDSSMINDSERLSEKHTAERRLLRSVGGRPRS